MGQLMLAAINIDRTMNALDVSSLGNGLYLIMLIGNGHVGTELSSADQGSLDHDLHPAQFLSSFKGLDVEHVSSCRQILN